METLGFELYLFFDYVSESGGEKYIFLADTAKNAIDCNIYHPRYGYTGFVSKQPG